MSARALCTVASPFGRQETPLRHPATQLVPVCCPNTERPSKVRLIEDIPSSTNQRKSIMNDVKQAACTCGTCNGSTCACGCQQPAQQAVCACGAQCKCEPVCVCVQA